jgi:hypothetical protein
LLNIEIVPVFQPSIFWQHKSYTPEELNQIDTFLTTFDKELKTFLIEPTLEVNYRILCEKIGLCVHPSLVERKRTSDFKNLTEEGYGERFAIFLNHRIDVATIKLLGFLLNIVKINTLKFSNNNLNEEELRALGALIAKDGKIIFNCRICIGNIFLVESTVNISSAYPTSIRYRTAETHPYQSHSKIFQSW